MFEKYQLKKAMRIAEKKIERGEIQVRSLEDAISDDNKYTCNEPNNEYTNTHNNTNDHNNNNQRTRNYKKSMRDFGWSALKFMSNDYTIGTLWVFIGTMALKTELNLPEGQDTSYVLPIIDYAIAAMWYSTVFFKTKYSRNKNRILNNNNNKLNRL